MTPSLLFTSLCRTPSWLPISPAIHALAPVVKKERNPQLANAAAHSLPPKCISRCRLARYDSDTDNHLCTHIAPCLRCARQSPSGKNHYLSHPIERILRWESRTSLSLSLCRGTRNQDRSRNFLPYLILPYLPYTPPKVKPSSALPSYGLPTVVTNLRRHSSSCCQTNNP